MAAVRSIEDWESTFALADPLKDIILQIQNTIQHERDGESLPNLNDLVQMEQDPSLRLAQFREARDKMSSYQNASIRRSQQLVDLNEKISSEAVNNLEEALKTIGSLREKNSYVSSKTSSLKNECENLLASQLALAEKAEYIDGKLNYFRGIDNVNRTLDQMNSTALTASEADQLLSCLNLLDEYYHSFIQLHIKYKDSALYEMRCKQAFSRAMVLVKTFVTATLNQLSSLASSHEFRALKVTLKPLIEAIESRCEKHPEYVYSLQEFNSVFFASRTRFISKPIQSFCSSLSRDILSSESVY